MPATESAVTFSFPRIDPALLWGGGHAQAPAWGLASLPQPYARADVRPAPGGPNVSAEIGGPPRSAWLSLLRRAASMPEEHAVAFWRALEGVRLTPVPPDGTLLTPSYLRAFWREAGVIPYAHQLEAARRVLFEMGGRAILADEVGLGKTIEAGIILHELLVRRLARRVLILVPAGLAWQWYQELRRKFRLPVELQASRWDWDRAPLLIASLDTAKRPPHRQEVLARPYDLVIVDEAHRLKNDSTRAFDLVAAVRSRYLLLVTATPVHNHLGELASLAGLVRQDSGVIPVPRRSRALVTQPEAYRLRRVVQDVMVRHRRAETSIPFTRRRVHMLGVTLTPGERELYAFLDGLMMARGEDGRTSRATQVLLWLTLKRELCSSPAALAGSITSILRRRPQLGASWSELAARVHPRAAWAKAAAALRLVRRLGDDHVLFFTEYVATQRALAERLASLGRPVVLFHGGLTPMQRDWAQSVFESKAPVMVSTDAGAEGVNLQFCRHVINVDLPWNPMRIEQRIGRVHRLGQTREVHVWNLFARSTVEEYVLYLLHEKLDLFRRFVGELDVIVESFGGVVGFEQAVGRLLGRVMADNPTAGLAQALEAIATEWERTRRALAGESRRG